MREDRGRGEIVAEVHHTKLPDPKFTRAELLERTADNGRADEPRPGPALGAAPR